MIDYDDTEVTVQGTITVLDRDGLTIGVSHVVDPKRSARGRYGNRKGSANEHRCMEVLRAKGYHCTRSSASLGAFDVIAFNADHALCIQVKSAAMPSPAERSAMLDVPVPANVHRIIWRWRPRGVYLVTELLAGNRQVPFLLPEDLTG